MYYSTSGILPLKSHLTLKQQLKYYLCYQMLFLPIATVD